MAKNTPNTALKAQQEYRAELDGFIQDWQTLRNDLAEMRALIQALTAPAAQTNTKPN
jgi:hypothetical protein